MYLRKSYQQKIHRMVVLRDAKGNNREVTLDARGVNTIRVPVITSVWPTAEFGAIDYTWDGNESNVQGLPVFRQVTA